MNNLELTEMAKNSSSLEHRNKFEPNYFYQFRLILIGDSTVGKSSLLRQFTEGQFIQASDPTVGVDFHVRIIELNGKFEKNYFVHFFFLRGMVNRPLFL